MLLSVCVEGMERGTFAVALLPTLPPPEPFATQAEEKAKARAAENWEWSHFEKDFTVPKDFVLFELEVACRSAVVRIERDFSSPIAELRFGGKARMTQVCVCAWVLVCASDRCGWSTIASSRWFLLFRCVYALAQCVACWDVSIVVGELVLKDLVTSGSSFPDIITRRVLLDGEAPAATAGACMRCMASCAACVCCSCGDAACRLSSQHSSPCTASNVAHHRLASQRRRRPRLVGRGRGAAALSRGLVS